MFSRSLLSSVRGFEMRMGYTEQCNQCRGIFLARGDGCPKCGSWNTISLLSEESPGNYQELNINDSNFYAIFIDEISGIAIILSENSVEKIEFSKEGKDCLYWVTFFYGEPFYVFPGDYSLWPREGSD